MSNDPPDNPPDATGNRGYGSVGGNTSVNIQGLTQATSQINAFNAAIASMQTQLTKFAQAAPGLSSTLSGSINKIGGAAGGGGGGGGGGGFMSNVGNVASSMFGAVGERGWARDMLMFPTRFMRSSIQDNRQMALMASAGLGSQAFATGASTQNIMGALAGQFGGVIGGNPQDLINLQNIASQVGAGINWQDLKAGANSARGGPRAEGFFRSVFEAQRMNPGQDVGSLATSIGGYAGNVGSQQQAAFLTGGAFSMIGAGNRQKPISEWAAGILKWLSNLRAGGNKGKAFTYPELMAQNFPGSNIDAWLGANGVTPDMKQVFWTFALGQASTGHSAVDDLFTKNAAVNESVAFNRLQAQGAQTRTGFRLAGTMAGAYANKEQANQYFAELTGHLLQQVLPAAMSTGQMSYMQYLPDTIEEIIMQLAERTNVGGAAAGLMGWGSGLSHLFEAGAGDVGDVGDYGSMGGTSTAGLHPDMRRKVDAMMSSNPRLRVTSGFRDLGTQQRLKRQGVGRVSGRPSAHTRGMAADLGPRSEYGWISANAGKFGLKSGRRQGEPWHVGMGDVGDDDILTRIQKASGLTDFMSLGTAGAMGNLFTSLFKTLLPGGGVTPEEQISGIGGATSALMQALVGIFGGTADMSRLAPRTGPGGVYDQMVKAGNKQRGMPTGFGVDEGGGGVWGGILQKIKDSMAGGGGGGTGTGPQGFAGPSGGGSVTGAAGTLGGFFTSVLQALGAPTSQQNLDKMGAVAKQEGYRAGAYNPFNYVGGKQFPAHNSVGVRNYPDAATGIEYTTKLLSQSNTAAMRANLQSDASYADWINATSNFYASWGGGRLNISQPKANAFLSTPLGDMDDSSYYPSPSTPMAVPSRQQVSFYNTFRIEGGGGGGGVDMGRTVTLLADKLEQEMNRRMAKRN